MIIRIWLLKAAKHSSDPGGRLALEIRVGKESRSDNLMVSEVMGITIPPTVLTRLLLAHHAIAGQPTWRITKQSAVYQIERGKARR
jgi:hypothetical protein